MIMYKITEMLHPDAMIRAVKRGVPVRIITEPTRYRNTDNVWQAYNLDRMYAAGVKIRERAHLGFLHQKTTLLYSQGRAIFGSSNWTTASNGSQYEHNYFATDPAFFAWFQKVFARKWASSSETRAFKPLPPDTPVYVAPANAVSGQSTTVTLSWKPGPWAHARRRLSWYLVDARAVRESDHRHARDRDQEGDRHRLAAGDHLLLENRVADDGWQNRDRTGLEFRDVGKKFVSGSRPLSHNLTVLPVTLPRRVPRR